MCKITLNVKEIAELIGVSTATIYSMVREKQIPHLRIRSSIVFHRETIESWLGGKQLQTIEQNYIVNK